MQSLSQFAAMTSLVRRSKDIYTGLARQNLRVTFSLLDEKKGIQCCCIAMYSKNVEEGLQVESLCRTGFYS